MTKEKLINHVVYKAGNGDPVVFIHGIEDDGTFWYPIDRAVSKFRQVLTIDLLGFGKSPQHDALSYTLGEHVEAIKNTLEQELACQKITLVAHSLGCYTALEYTKLYPNKVEKLILSSPVVILDNTNIKPRDLYERIQMFALSRIGMTRKAVLKKAEQDSSPASLKRMVKSFWPSIKNIETLVEKQNIPAQIQAITGVPILINYGALDPLVINSDVESLTQINPKIKIYKFGVGHDVVHAKSYELFSELVPDVPEKEIPPILYEKRRLKIGVEVEKQKE